MTNLNSYRYNGLIHKKTVGIVDAPDKKGFTVVYKKARKQVRFEIRKCFLLINVCVLFRGNLEKQLLREQWSQDPVGLSTNLSVFYRRTDTAQI